MILYIIFSAANYCELNFTGLLELRCNENKQESLPVLEISFLQLNLH